MKSNLSKPGVLLTLILLCSLWAVSANAGVQKSRMAVKPDTVKAYQLMLAHYPYLKRGINIDGWFYNRVDSNDHGITMADIQKIHQMGFTHIRLPLDPMWLMNPQNPTRPTPSQKKEWEALRNAVKMILSQHMAVILDIHPENQDYFRSLATSDAYVNTFSKFVIYLVQQTHSSSQDRIFYEVLNEPDFSRYTPNPSARWQDVQNKLIAAVRSVTPNNTIIVKGLGDRISDLKTLTPVSDKNVIYSFHDYDPLAFTHQGATWTGINAIKIYRQLPYPGSRQLCGPILRKMSPVDWFPAIDYCNQQFGPATIQSVFSSLDTWAKQRHVKLYLGEFGVMKPNVNPVDRARWIKDMRQASEKYGMGWAMWEYDHAFGLTYDNRQGPLTADPNILKALGLKSDQK